ncbi:MAG: DeoR family transcriptional regulator [Candidatus Omnitrophota bacterium]
MVRNVDYESRKRSILAATINKYIQSASAVASEDIAREFNLSSATIRNIFAEMEEAGYLTHLHTSGGRIPTKKGYRYYVDFLVSEMQLLDVEKESIVKGYKREMNRLEDALEETSEVISAITHYASIVSLLDWQDRFFYKGISFILEQPEFQDSTRIKLLIKMIEEKRNLLNIINREFKDKTMVYIGDELECEGVNSCALVVAHYNINNKPLGRIAVLGPMRMEYQHIIPALEYVSEVLSEVLGRI